MKINEILQNIKSEKLPNKRAFIIEEIYNIYTSDPQRLFRKKENWKRYILFLKENKIPTSKENEKKFKKSKQFIKEHNLKSFIYFISIIPTADLSYILSVAKDMNNRKQNMSAWIMGNLVRR